MRNDLEGLFWNDTPIERVKKEKIVRTPPERVWEKDDYLPYLEEAKAFKLNLFTDDELLAHRGSNDFFIFDCESYSNYFLVGFTSFQTGKIVYLESREGESIDINKLGWLITNFPIVGFNSKEFDLTLITFALAGAIPEEIKEVTNAIIQMGERGSDILDRAKLRTPQIDHIDLIEICPLQGSLKLYGGRLHTPRIQELPFRPETWLSEDQIAVVRWYCLNADLVSTGYVRQALSEQIQLREKLTMEYGVDVRSKSDAQVAEAVITTRLKDLIGKVKRPEIDPGTVYRYETPDFIRFHTSLMQQALKLIQDSQFVVQPNGTITLPPHISEMKLPMGDSVYRFGIGGLHSSETRAVHYADEQNELWDIDVASYYPRIILTCRLFPEHLGTAFLFVYKSIVERRLEAKARGEKQVAESLKITINGTFGKLSNPWSRLYAPRCGMQVTITGQLSLLMLIEMFELAGFPVVSGNTDGIVVKVSKARTADAEAIVKLWETQTTFETERVNYLMLASRDVNNYFALKPDGTFKLKGAYADPWGQLAKDSKQSIMRFHKNPQGQVCITAVCNYLAGEVPIRDTLLECKDITRFIFVRNIKGGGAKNGEYVGKTARWYYATSTPEPIVYVSSGNKVPRSEGAKPCMNLPAEFPDDVDFEWYERECKSMLYDIGISDENPDDIQPLA
jgi:hypothetical protein